MLPMKQVPFEIKEDGVEVQYEWVWNMRRRA